MFGDHCLGCLLHHRWHLCSCHRWFKKLQKHSFLTFLQSRSCLVDTSALSFVDASAFGPSRNWLLAILQRLLKTFPRPTSVVRQSINLWTVLVKDHKHIQHVANTFKVFKHVQILKLSDGLGWEQLLGALLPSRLPGNLNISEECPALALQFNKHKG